MTRAQVTTIRATLAALGVDDVGDITDQAGTIRVQVRGTASSDGIVVAALVAAVPRAFTVERAAVRPGRD